MKGDHAPRIRIFAVDDRHFGKALARDMHCCQGLNAAFAGISDLIWINGFASNNTSDGGAAFVLPTDSFPATSVGEPVERRKL